MKVGDLRHGFRVERITPVPEVRATAFELAHEKSGARFLHLLCDDPENLFAIAFRTPPQDDTGLPHILEHTVLCGSEKYPVKDPFVELLKTSLATFLNAMTYPDKTVYPCASMNEKDFFNLASVYCDATLRPLITEQHFKQEGHHYEFAEPGNPQSPLTINGIVYNEMKGAYSDLDGVMEREETRRICPDNAYGLDSGGDPAAIPTLTYEKFRDFHRRYYHPANSFIFVYGDIPTLRHLEFLDREYLGAYDRIGIDTTIATQPRWDTPRRATIPYPAEEGDTPQEKSAVVTLWLTNDVTDAVTSLALNLLDNYLLGNAASPLRKALIDSKFGQELTSAGYADFQRDTFFTVGLKGTAPQKEEEIAELVLATCRTQAEKGFDRNMIEAAFHQLRMSALEIKPQYPLRLMERVYRNWLYDADPLYYLRLERHLENLYGRFQNEPRFLENILLAQIVDNPHRLTLTFVPDPDYNRRSDEEFAAKMAQIKAQLSGTEVESINREAAELERMQMQPNTPEALATLPRLNLRDVPQEPLEPPISISVINDRPVLESGLFTGGLNYLSLALDVRDFDEQMLRHLSIYCLACAGMGAAGLDYAAFAQKEAACCGGISISPDAFGTIDNPGLAQPFVFFNVRGLKDKLPQMLKVLQQRLLEPDLSDLDRLKDVILQARINTQAGLIQQGNAFASAYATRGLSVNAHLKEFFGGFTNLRLLNQLADDFQPETLVPVLERIRQKLANRKRLSLAVSGDEASRELMKKWFDKLSGSLIISAINQCTLSLPQQTGGCTGIATAADVAFVARSLPSICANHPAAPALNLIGLNLSFGHLWNEVRVRRGAYGCRAGHQPALGAFCFSSYRDPCINETLAVYDEAFQHFLTGGVMNQESLEQAIIGTLKTLDVPWRPAQVLSGALSRHLSGSTTEARRTYRRNLLTLSPQRLYEAINEILLPALTDSPVCVLSNRQKLEEARRKGLAIEIEGL